MFHLERRRAKDVNPQRAVFSESPLRRHPKSAGAAIDAGFIRFNALTRLQAALMFRWSAVQLLSATLLFRSVRGALCLSEWGIPRPFSTPAPEKVCCGSSSSESSWRERQTGEAAGSRTFEAQALESIRGNVFFSNPGLPMARGI